MPVPENAAPAIPLEPQHAARHRIRVRYADSDQMGVAHHAAYVVWFEECRIAMLRERGCSYRDLEASGVLMPVVDLQVRYRQSVRFDDGMLALTWAHAVGRSRLRFTTRLYPDAASADPASQNLLAEAAVVVVATGRDGRPMRLPDTVLRLLTVPSAGDGPADRT